MSHDSCSDQVFTWNNWYGASLWSGWTHLHSLSTSNNTRFSFSWSSAMFIPKYQNLPAPNVHWALDRTNTAFFATNSAKIAWGCNFHACVVAAYLLTVTTTKISTYSHWAKKQCVQKDCEIPTLDENHEHQLCHWFQRNAQETYATYCGNTAKHGQMKNKDKNN